MLSVYRISSRLYKERRVYMTSDERKGAYAHPLVIVSSKQNGGASFVIPRLGTQ